jgi:hypothetical protein
MITVHARKVIHCQYLFNIFP